MSALSYVLALKAWVNAVARVAAKWKNGEFVDVLEKELRAIEYTRLQKWFSARRCMEQVLTYIKAK